MIIAAAVASLMTGCAAESALGPSAPTSQFSATVSGVIQAPLAGSAVLFAIPAATVDSVALPPSNILGMADRSSATVVGFKWQNVATLAPGSYTVGTDTSTVAMMYDMGTGGAGSTFTGTAGTVTITTATDQLVTGSYDVSATAGDTGGTIRVSGSFTAIVRVGPIQ